MKFFKRLLPMGIAVLTLVTPGAAMAGDLVDALNLAPFVPIVLDALMMIATGGYEFFVGHGDGIIYVLIWGFLAVSLSLYLVKLYLPKIWVEFFGFSGGGDMAAGKAGATTIATNMLRPVMRAVLAAVVLLQIKPVYMTQWLINPFLQFGALYTHSITETINAGGIAAPDVACPPDVLSKDWISPESCKFLVQPVSDLSYANNRIIKQGFDFITRGLRGLMTLIPHGGEDFFNLITGVLLVTTFVSCNLFMALLIIQAIFEFGMALILYPFQVLVWVVKPKNPDKWFDVWPAFGEVTKALQKIIVTMIACAFILCINMAIIRSLFGMNASVFTVAAGGAATSNVPTMSAGGFGRHSLIWLSSILTFYLMLKIFDMTRQQLTAYVGGGTDKLYNQVMKSDVPRALKIAQDNIKKLKDLFGDKKKK